MSEELIEITGIEEVCEMLQAAPKSVMPRALLAGLSAGGRVIEAAIAARVPIRVSASSSGALEVEGGDLASDLDMTVTLDSEFRGGVAAVGFGDQGYIARFVEYGHHMIGHKPDKKALGEVEPHPFMRPAAETCADAAVEAFVDAAMSELQAGGIVDAA